MVRRFMQCRMSELTGRMIIKSELSPAVPSPWGEGQGEGGFSHGIEVSTREKAGILSSHTLERSSKICSPVTRSFCIFTAMKSMTGYGRGECAQDGFKITAELSAVNRRQTEISVNLPCELETL